MFIEELINVKQNYLTFGNRANLFCIKYPPAVTYTQRIDWFHIYCSNNVSNNFIIIDGFKLRLEALISQITNLKSMQINPNILA